MATTPAVQAFARQRPRLGKKQIFLPNFTLILLRTPALPATFASFIAPLNINKLDLRDYLYNAYGITVRGVRSYVQMQKLRQDKPGEKYPRPRKWFRPKSIKKMMVEMDKPFVWPEEPENLDMWDKKTYDAAQKDRDNQESQFRPGHREKPASDRASIAEQARALLRGDDPWRSAPAEDVWEDDGEAEEVEKEVDISRVK